MWLASLYFTRARRLDTPSVAVRPHHFCVAATTLDRAGAKYPTRRSGLFRSTSPRRLWKTPGAGRAGARSGHSAHFHSRLFVFRLVSRNVAVVRVLTGQMDAVEHRADDVDRQAFEQP